MRLWRHDQAVHRSRSGLPIRHSRTRARGAEVSDHIEHSCFYCGSLLHFKEKCPGHNQSISLLAKEILESINTLYGGAGTFTQEQLDTCAVQTTISLIQYHGRPRQPTNKSPHSPQTSSLAK